MLAQLLISPYITVSECQKPTEIDIYMRYDMAFILSWWTASAVAGFIRVCNVCDLDHFWVQGLEYHTQRTGKVIYTSEKDT